MSERIWRVGALAAAAGVSVRTLHHYEAAGLLPPAARAESGYRIYRDSDVRRLYQVLALRSLGLSLPAIRACLGREDGSLRGVVQRHLQTIEQQLHEQTRLRDRLRTILLALEREEQPSADRFLEVMEAMAMFERYYTPEQLAQLEQRRQMLGDEAIKHAEQEWAELIQEAEAARQAGLDPASAAVQALWRRWQALVEQFTGGDPGIRQSLQRMYETEGPGQASHGMVSSELMAYIQRAAAAGRQG
jgi:DNA-binding transcriptional MerR regulator